MSLDKRKRPGCGTEALEDLAWRRSHHSLAPQPVIDGVLAAVVATGAEPCRRRVYLSLRSAEEAVRRARNAGIPARVVLVEMRPLGGAE